MNNEYVELVFNVDKNHFIITANAKTPKSLLNEFLIKHPNIDNFNDSRRNEYTEYRVIIEKNLETGEFKINSNCGSTNLRNDIIKLFLNRN
jgi:hypothetical protein